jgi:hypothetical protein
MGGPRKRRAGRHFHVESEALDEKDRIINSLRNEVLIMRKRARKRIVKIGNTRKEVNKQKNKWPAKVELTNARLLTKKFDYMYALVGFPVILNWIKTNKLTPMDGAILMIISYHKIIHLWEIKNWLPTRTRGAMTRLIERGLVIEQRTQSGIAKNRKSYVMAPVAIDMIEDFKVFYDDFMKKRKKSTIFNSKEQVVKKDGRKRVAKRYMPKDYIEYAKTQQQT